MSEFDRRQFLQLTGVGGAAFVSGLPHKACDAMTAMPAGKD